MQKQTHVFFRKCFLNFANCCILLCMPKRFCPKEKVVLSAKKSPSKKTSTFGGGCGRCCRGGCCGGLVIAWTTQKTSFENKNNKIYEISPHFGGCVVFLDGCKVSVVMVVKGRPPPRRPPHLVVVVAGAAVVVVVVVSSLLEQPRRPPNSNLHWENHYTDFG